MTKELTDRIAILFKYLFKDGYKTHITDQIKCMEILNDHFMKLPVFNSIIYSLKELKSMKTPNKICVHPFDKVISTGSTHNCTLCGKNI